MLTTCIALSFKLCMMTLPPTSIIYVQETFLKETILPPSPYPAILPNMLPTQANTKGRHCYTYSPRLPVPALYYHQSCLIHVHPDIIPPHYQCGQCIHATSLPPPLSYLAGFHALADLIPFISISAPTIIIGDFTAHLMDSYTHDV